MIQPQPTAPTLTDALLLELKLYFQGRAMMRTEPSWTDVERILTQSGFAAARPAGVTPNYDAALAKWNEWEDENADLMRWDGDVRYQAMCAAVDAARATADAAAEGGA